MQFRYKAIVKEPLYDELELIKNSYWQAKILITLIGIPAKTQKHSI